MTVPGEGDPIGFVVPTSAGLLALGYADTVPCTAEGEGSTCPPEPIAMWTSVDGTSWSRQPTPSVFEDGAEVTGLASGPGGLIAVGDRGFDRPRIWTSPDGSTWQRLHLTADVFRKAHFLDVAAIPGGWLIVGATGGTPPTGSAIVDPNGSRGAAWLSADGRTWTRAKVAGHGPQVELRSVYQGADGLAALGTREGGKAGTLWTSQVGRRWSLAPSTSGSHPTWPIAADGERIIGESYVDGDYYSFSVSGDGKTWRALANLGETATMPRWPGPSGAPSVDSAFLLPDGVVFMGMDNDGRTIIWHATGVPLAEVPQPSPSPSGPV